MRAERASPKSCPTLPCPAYQGRAEAGLRPLARGPARPVAMCMGRRASRTPQPEWQAQPLVPRPGPAGLALGCVLGVARLTQAGCGSEYFNELPTPTVPPVTAA